MMIPPHIKSMIVLSAAGATLLATTASGQADVVLGNRIGIDFGPKPVLSTSLHGRVSAETQTVDYTVSGTFKIGRTAVAKLRTFSGTATTTPSSIVVHVSPATVKKLRAVGARHHAKRTTLTLTEKLAGHSTVFHEDKYFKLTK